MLLQLHYLFFDMSYTKTGSPLTLHWQCYILPGFSAAKDDCDWYKKYEQMRTFFIPY